MMDVSFISKKLHKHHRSYATVEKEAYDLKTAVEHFHVYLDTGMPIQMFNDHSPLQYLEQCPIATINCCPGDCHCRSCRCKSASTWTRKYDCRCVESSCRSTFDIASRNANCRSSTCLGYDFSETKSLPKPRGV